MGEYDGVFAAIGVALAIGSLVAIGAAAYFCTRGMLEVLKITNADLAIWAPIGAAIACILIVSRMSR